MPNSYTKRDEGLLTAQEAQKILMDYRRRAGIPVNTTEAQKPTDHPFVQEILVELGHEPDCPVCRDGGALRLDLPVGHPHFGRLARCECRE